MTRKFEHAAAPEPPPEVPDTPDDAPDVPVAPDEETPAEKAKFAHPLDDPNNPLHHLRNV